MKLITLLLLCIATSTHADTRMIASLETGFFVRNGQQTAGTRHENGKYLFVGKAGIEHDVDDGITLFGTYTHRSNIDLVRREYWYDSINIGLRISHCFSCHKKD